MAIDGEVEDNIDREPGHGFKKRSNRLLEYEGKYGASYMKNETIISPSTNIFQAHDGQLYWNGHVIGGGGGATLSVAASNASAKSKARADYVCDGVADEVEINQALSDLPAAGGKVQLSEGTFNIVDSITIPDDRVNLEGMGHNSHISGAGLATGEHAITINGQSNCMLRNFMISTGAGGGRTCHCVYVTGDIIGLVIDNILFYDSDANGVHIYADTTIVRSRITNCLFRADDVYSIYVSGNAVGGSVSDLLIQSNIIFQSGSAGILFDTGSGGGYSNCSIIGNVMSSPTTNGIILYDTVYTSINDNNIDQTGDDGILIEDSNYCTFNGNMISSSTAGSCIKLTANCDLNSIVGNVLSGYNQYGVEIAAISVEDTIVSGNSIPFGGVAHILDSGLRTKHRIQHRDIFMDCLATVGNHVVNAQNLVNGAVAINLQPDVPRYISYTITEGAPGDVTDYTITIVGVNAQGEAVTFTTDFTSSGLIRFIDENFLYITSITLADVADLGAATISIGIEDRLGLSNRIIAGSVYAVKRNTAYDDPANWTEFVIGNGVNVDDVAAIVGGDDFMIYYWESLNILG